MSRNYCFIVTLFFLNSFLVTGQFEKENIIKGTYEMAQNFSKEKNALTIFISEGNLIGTKKDTYTLEKYATTLYDSFNNLKYTYFPTKIRIFYKNSNESKQTEVWMFSKGKSIELSKNLIQNRNKLNMSKSAYHPVEVGKNIWYITMEFSKNNFKDNRDGHIYEYISYTYGNGEKVSWMTENLNYKTSNSIAYK